MFFLKFYEEYFLEKDKFYDQNYGAGEEYHNKVNVHVNKMLKRVYDVSMEQKDYRMLNEMNKAVLKRGMKPLFN